MREGMTSKRAITIKQPQTLSDFVKFSAGQNGKKTPQGAERVAGTEGPSGDLLSYIGATSDHI